MFRKNRGKFFDLCKIFHNKQLDISSIVYLIRVNLESNLSLPMLLFPNKRQQDHNRLNFSGSFCKEYQSGSTK